MADDPTTALVPHRVPDDVFRQIAVIPPDEHICYWHDDQDPDTMEPRGNQCGKPATHILLFVWDDSLFVATSQKQKWSFACAEHKGPPGIDPSGTHGWQFRAFEFSVKQATVVHLP